MKEEFKEFVKKNPRLVEFVRKDEMTWQKFYDIYNLYGENSEVWDKYIKEGVKETVKVGIAGLTLTEIFNWVKSIDLDGLQEGISNVQRVLGVVQDFSNKDNHEKSNYRPKPLYKHFDD